MALVVVFPIGVIPLLGYMVAAVRSSAQDPAGGPPAWSSPGRLLGDGMLVASLLAALSVPFVFLILIGGEVLGPRLVGVPGAADATISALLGAVLAGVVVGLPWGILLLVLMPAAVSRFATGGRPLDLFNLPAALRLVRRKFAAWNLVAVAIVTAWAIGLAGLGLLGVGVIPGFYFALLASAHATAALDD